MPTNAQLEGYGTVAIVDESTQHLNDANGSWVEANVILPAKLIEIEEKKNPQESTSSAKVADDTVAPTPVFRDAGFGVLFLVHLAVFILVGITYGSFGTSDNKSGSSSENTNSGEVSSMVGMATLLVSSAVIGFVITYFITALFLPKFPTLVIQASLYGSLFSYTFLGIIIFLSRPNLWTFLFGLFIIGLNIWYVGAVQRFVPFAATNLKMAAKAIATNFGIFFISILISTVGAIWAGFWAYTATGLGIFDGVKNAVATTSNETTYYYDYYDAGLTDAILGLKGFGLLLSLYWTATVLANITQTTTAGVTGTWCFDKNNASSCCSSAVSQSLLRSCTYSFGSICFGSLLSALVTTLRVMAQWARDSDRNSRENGAALLYCLLTCILSCIESIIEYFNQWAYIFVGIWGLSYLEGGKRALEMFAARGCTAIISDNLANYVLGNVIVFTSLVCGVFGYVFSGFNGGCFM